MRRIALLVLLTSILAAPALAGPKAVPTAPIYDFDIVAKGEVLTHDFSIRNDGDAPLEIQNVHPACGCTVAKFDSVIAPGATGRIHAEVDTRDFLGPISKSIAVLTNDPDNPKLQLVVRAKVKAYIGGDPGYARFLYVQREPTQPVRQVFWSEDNHPLRVLDVRTTTGKGKNPSTKIDVDFHQASGAERKPEIEKQQWVVDIHLNENAEVGPLQEFVEVVTDHPKQPVVLVPVSGFVRPRQHITPMEVDFGNLQGDSLPLRRSFTFTNFITDRITVTKIDTGMTGVSAEMEDSDSRPGHRFRLMLKLEPDMPKGEFETVIKIHTTDSKNPVMELPVKGVVI